MSKQTFLRASCNLYSWTSIADPSKVIVYFLNGIPRPDHTVYFSGGGLNCQCIAHFLEVAPQKGKHDRKRYWIEQLRAKVKYP